MSHTLPPYRYIDKNGNLVPFERNGCDGIADRRNMDVIMTCACGKKYTLHIPYELANPETRDLCDDCYAEKYLQDTPDDRAVKVSLANEVLSWNQH